MHGLKTISSLAELALLNSGLFIFFACGFFESNSKRHWSMYGPLRGFVTALFTRMYGVPLTLYAASGWFQPRLPGIERFSHWADRLLQDVMGLTSRPHLGLLMALGFLFVASGATLTASAWAQLYRAVRSGTMATQGAYARIRHPVYAGLVILSFGVLLECPALSNLLMFPVLVVMYVRLAREDERLAVAALGDPYLDYMARVPRFAPRRRGAIAPELIARVAGAAQPSRD